MSSSTLLKERDHCRALNDPLNLNTFKLACQAMLGLRVVSV